MTRKDYERVAAILKSLPTTPVRTGPGRLPFDAYHAMSLIEAFCENFKAENPRFDKKLFITACGFEPWDELVMGFAKPDKGDK